MQLFHWFTALTLLKLVAGDDIECYDGTMTDSGDGLDRSQLTMENNCNHCQVKVVKNGMHLQYDFACLKEECKTTECVPDGKNGFICCCDTSLCSGHDAIFEQVISHFSGFTDATTERTTQTNTKTKATATNSKTQRTTTTTNSNSSGKTSSGTETTSSNSSSTTASTGSPKHSTTASGMKSWEIILIVTLTAGTVVILLVTITVYACVRRRRKQKKFGKQKARIESNESKKSKAPTYTNISTVQTRKKRDVGDKRTDTKSQTADTDHSADETAEAPASFLDDRWLPKAQTPLIIPEPEPLILPEN